MAEEHTPEQTQEIDAAISAVDGQDAPAEQKADDTDFSRMFEEFDNANPKPEPKQDDPLRFDEPLTQEHAIIDYLSALEQDRAIQRERADVDAIMQRAAAEISFQKDLPADYARLRMEQWARNEYASNAEFQQAWDNRHSTAEAGQYVTRAVNRAIANLKTEVSHPRVDVEATADREAIAAAMRGSGKPPPERAPDFASMNDADFRGEVDKAMRQAGRPNG